MDGFTASSLLSPKLSGIQIVEGVKPHQKLSAAGTLLRSRHGWLYGVFLMGLHSRNSKSQA